MVTARGSRRACSWNKKFKSPGARYSIQSEDTKLPSSPSTTSPRSVRHHQVSVRARKQKQVLGLKKKKKKKKAACLHLH